MAESVDRRNILKGMVSLGVAGFIGVPITKALVPAGQDGFQFPKDQDGFQIPKAKLLLPAGTEKGTLEEQTFHPINVARGDSITFTYQVNLEETVSVYGLTGADVLYRRADGQVGIFPATWKVKET